MILRSEGTCAAHYLTLDKVGPQTSMMFTTKAFVDTPHRHTHGKATLSGASRVIYMFTYGTCIRPLCNHNYSGSASIGAIRSEGVQGSSRGGALAVRVVAGLVNGDFDVRFLSTEPGEHEGEHESGRSGMTNHGCRMSSMWFEERLPIVLCRLIYIWCSTTSLESAGHDLRPRWRCGRPGSSGNQPPGASVTE